MLLIRTRTDGLTLALVALLHLLLLLWLELREDPREAHGAAASRLRLIPLLRPRDPQPPRQDPRPAQPRSALAPQAARPAPAVPPADVGAGLPQAPALSRDQADGASGAVVALPGPPASAPPRPLDLRLPVTVVRPTGPSMAEQVARDPRSHTPRLTFSEKFAIALGTIECIYEELRPDGSIYRAPGRLVAKATAIVPATGKEATGRGGDTVGVCEK